ncbi:UDP-3-O-(3-hydroxymyristoyl)glucosamine N-acyltransferase [bacterium]|nr:UDP-3-O-(3-hydroxymyristoyl)glucosamine N-acyltransferase [bacterium]
MNNLSLAELVERFGCVVHESAEGLGQGPWTGISPLSSASPSHISFLNNPRYVAEALASRAGVILCGAAEAEHLASQRSKEKVQKSHSLLLVCKNPYAVFARVSQHFFTPVHSQSGVSAQCFVDASAHIDPSATLFPFTYVGPGAHIGARTVLYPGAFVGAAASVGDDCLLHPNAVVREGCRLGDRCILNPGAVVGGDGFGFAPDGEENVKIPQVGAVALGNDVEIGSNASIDRGAMLDTVVAEQTKIDSLVQIGHNVSIGKACFIAAGTGIAGSSEIGNRVTLAGQVGVAGHLKIADKVTVLAQAGVTKSLTEAGVYSGYPARPNREWLAYEASLQRIVKERRESRAAEIHNKDKNS